MQVVEMNYLAILVGAVVSVVIGAVWYSAALFGNAWMALIGKTSEQVAREFSPLKIVWAFVLGFMTSYGLARLIVWTGRATPVDGLLLGVLVCVVFAMTSIAVNHVFEGRPARLTLIYALHHLVEFAAIGLLLGAWM
jgi:uncharacterized membrane protein